MELGKGLVGGSAKMKLSENKKLHNNKTMKIVRPIEKYGTNKTGYINKGNLNR